jgi:hypothetical protein
MTADSVLPHLEQSSMLSIRASTVNDVPLMGALIREPADYDRRLREAL